MTENLTVKQEMFAMKYMECGNASEAYRCAYDARNMKNETIHVKACELLSRDKIKVRVEELKAENQKRHNVTIDYLTDEIKEAIQMAKEGKDASNLRGGAMDLAKLHGLLVDKKDVSLTNYVKFLEGLEDE